MGAPVGNQNASNVKVWSDAIRRAMARAEHDPVVGHRTLNALADRLLEKAAEGDMAALKELGDRLEGKPAQTIDAKVEGGLTVTIASTDVGL